MTETNPTSGSGPGYTTRETPLVASDGVSLHTKSWLPSSSSSSSSAAVAQICFIHGFSDHSDRYAAYFPLLAARGIAVHALDQRGFGRSVTKTAERGLTGPTSTVMRDISTFLAAHVNTPSTSASDLQSRSGTGAESSPPALPTFLMGHSMGGQEVLYWASTAPAEQRAGVAGFIAVGPWIQLHRKSQPSWVKLKAGKAASLLLPRFQLVQPLDASVLSHNAAENENWKADELCHDTGTLQGFDGALTRAEELHAGTVRLDQGLRVLLVHGAEDMVTSPDASGAFVRRNEGVKGLKSVFYEGVYHNVHIDAPERLRDDVLQFITEVIGPASGASGASDAAVDPAATVAGSVVDQSASQSKL